MTFPVLTTSKGDHFECGVAECAGNRGQEDRTKESYLWGCRARRTTSGSEYTSREHREVRQGRHLGRPGPDEPRTKLVLRGTMRHGRSPKPCKAPTCFSACPPAARLLILAIADQPLIFEGSEIAYDVVLASRPEAIVGSVARTAWSAGRRGGRMISYCEQLERRVGKAHEVMHLMIHKAKRLQAPRLH